MVSPNSCQLRWRHPLRLEEAVPMTTTSETVTGTVLPACPLLIVFAGRAGTGKTTLSRMVAAELCAAILRVDVVEAAVVRHGLGEHPVGPIGYAVAHDLAVACLAVGTTVVVDAVNGVPEARAAWPELASEAGVPLAVVEVSLNDQAEHRRRVEQRVSDLEGMVVPTWEQVVDGGYVPWQPDRDGARLQVDGAQDSALAEILAYLATF
jgi:predicted kinase